MANELLETYDRLQNELRGAERLTTQTKAEADEAVARYEAAHSDQARIQRELATARDRLDKALQQASPKPKPASLPAALRPSVRSTIEAFPPDGEHTTLANLRKKLNLSEGAVNTRIQNAKDADMVVRCGRGKYKLTDEGQKAVKPRLHAVGSN